MAGLVPAMHVFKLSEQAVDARHNSGPRKVPGGRMARVALVTGGTRGIGAAIAKALQGGRLQGRGQLRRQRRSGGEIQSGNRHRGVQVGRVVLRRLRRRREEGAGRARPDRSAGQQCRHHPRRHVPPHEAGAVDRGDQHQSRLAVQHDPAGLGRHARAQVRPRRQHLLDQRPEGPDADRPITPPPRPARSASPRRWRRKARAPASP